jgi:hypothetical protein
VVTGTEGIGAGTLQKRRGAADYTGTINASGNARHGQAFVLSVKDGVEQNIYGSGDDRVVISNGK